MLATKTQMVAGIIIRLGHVAEALMWPAAIVMVIVGAAPLLETARQRLILTGFNPKGNGTEQREISVTAVVPQGWASRAARRGAAAVRSRETNTMRRCSRVARTGRKGSFRGESAVVVFGFPASCAD